MASPESIGSRRSDEFDFDVFLSYDATDEAVATALQSGLHNLFRHPLRPRPFMRVFRDKTDLPAGGKPLEAKLKDALTSSSHLAVILTPASAKSFWVNSEIADWRSKVDPTGQRIIPVIARTSQPIRTLGEAYWTGAEVPEALREVFGESEPLAVDMRSVLTNHDRSEWVVSNPAFREKAVSIASARHNIEPSRLEGEISSMERGARVFRRFASSAAIAAVVGGLLAVWFFAQAASSAAEASESRESVVTAQRDLASTRTDLAEAEQQTEQAQLSQEAAEAAAGAAATREQNAEQAKAAAEAEQAEAEAAAVSADAAALAAEAEAAEAEAAATNAQAAQADAEARQTAAEAARASAQALAAEAEAAQLRAEADAAAAEAAEASAEAARLTALAAEATAREGEAAATADAQAATTRADEEAARAQTESDRAAEANRLAEEADVRATEADRLADEADRLAEAADLRAEEADVRATEADRLADEAGQRATAADLQAEAARRRTAVLTLVAESLTLRSTDPPLALVLALEALTLTDGQPAMEAERAEARSALSAARMSFARRPAHPVGEPLHRHSNYVWDVAYNEDNSQRKRLVSGGADHRVQIWKLDGGDPSYERTIIHELRADATDANHIANSPEEPLPTHDEYHGVWAVAISDDGEWVASGGANYTLQLWNLNNPLTPVILKKESAPGAEARDADSSPSVQTGVQALDFGRIDGRLVLASGDAAGNLELWDVLNGASEQPRRVRPGGPVRALAFNHDDSLLAVASSSQGVFVYRSALDQPEALSRGLRGTAVSGVAFNHDSSQLAASLFDGRVFVWDRVGAGNYFSNGLEAAEVELTPAFNDIARGVAFNADGDYLAVSGDDNTVRIVDAGTRRQAGEPLRGHADSVLGGVTFANDLIASASADQTVRLWKLSTPVGLSEPVAGGAEISLNDQTPNGHRLTASTTGATPRFAFGGDDGQVKVWSLSDGTPTGPVVMSGAHNDRVNGVAMSSDGRTLVSGGGEKGAGTVRVWNLDSNPPTSSFLPTTGASILSVALSPDGTAAVASGPDGRIDYWRLGQGELRRETLTGEGHEGNVHGVAISPDGRFVASVGQDRAVILWDISQGASNATPRPLELPLDEGGHLDEVWNVTFNSDGSQLASASEDNTAILWNLGASITGHRLVGHSDWVWDVAFSQDDSYLATAGKDGEIRLWDATDGMQIGEPLSESSSNELQIRSIVSLQDGRLAAAQLDEPPGEPSKAELRLWANILDEDQACDLAFDFTTPDIVRGYLELNLPPDIRAVAETSGCS